MKELKKTLLVSLMVLMLAALSLTGCGGGDTGGGGSTVSTGGTGGTGGGDTGGSSGTDNLDFDHLAYGGGKFVVIGNQTLKAPDTARIGYSSDGGKTWKAVNQSSVTSIFPGTLSPRVNAVYSIAYGGGKFIAGGEDGKTAISTDGVTWTAGTPYGTYSFRAIAYGNDKFVASAGATGYDIAYSTDGSTWTKGTRSGTQATIVAIAYGDAKWVAGESKNYMNTSTDGITWTRTSSISSLSDVKAIAYGAGKFVAVGYATIAYSENGTTWTETERSSSGTSKSDRNYDIAFGNNKFVVVGTTDGYSKAIIATSTDGVNWTDGTVPSSFADETKIDCIAFGDGTFVIGSGSKVAYFN